MRLTTRYALLGTLAAALASCGDSTGSDPLPAGRFTATVTGAVSLQLNGTASSRPSARDIAQYDLQLNDNAGNFIRVMAIGEGFSRGSVAIGLDSTHASAMFYTGDGTAFGVATGTMRVDSVWEGGVRGHLEFTARDEFSAGTPTVRVTADFNALRETQRAR